MARKKYADKNLEHYARRIESINRVGRTLRTAGFDLAPQFRFPSASKRAKQGEITQEELDRLDAITTKLLKQTAVQIGEDGFEILTEDTPIPEGWDEQLSTSVYEGQYDVDAEYTSDRQSIYVENLERLYDDCEKFPTSSGANKIKEWLDSAVESFGKEAVGRLAEQMYYEGHIIGKTLNPSDDASMFIFLNNMIVRFEQLVEQMNIPVIDEDAKEEYDILSSEEAQEKLLEEAEEWQTYQEIRRSKKNKRRKNR